MKTSSDIMSLLLKIKEKILSKSDSYNFYKDEYHKNEKRYAELNKKIEKNHKEYVKFTKQNKKQEKSNYNLFNTLFLYYDLKPKGLLNDVQQFCIELLDFVDNVCKKHNIDYWIDYGSLLGAVRHEGFIPWDDDMDIGMVRKDFEKFIDVIDEEIKNNNLEGILNIRKVGKNAKGYIHTFIQVAYYVPDEKNPKNRIALSGIDIFPYDFIPSYDDDTTEKFGNAKIDYQDRLKSGMSKEEAIELYIDEFNIDRNDGNYVIPAIENIRGPNNNYKLYFYKKEDIFPLINVEICGKEYPGPNNSDIYLKSLYSDKYMQLPQVVHLHQRLPNLSKYENIRELMKIHLSSIREINENFR